MALASGEAPAPPTAIVTTEKCYIRPYTLADAAAGKYLAVRDAYLDFHDLFSFRALPRQRGPS